MSSRYIPIIDYTIMYLYDVGIIGIIMVFDTTRANGVLTNFLVESSLLLRICIFYTLPRVRLPNKREHSSTACSLTEHAVAFYSNAFVHLMSERAIL